MIAPTHVRSSSASVVIDIDELTISDLQDLIGIKRARERTSQDELYMTLLYSLDQMPRRLADEVAAELDELHPGLVLERHFPEILLAKYGAASVVAWGYSASVAA